MPPRKKTKEARAPQKPTVPKLRGRRGSLAAMPRVPLDVIIEILGYLHPRDILSLAQTSKDFRALLLNRQHAFIWKAARKALPGGLPDPHPYMSEPALTQLMFSSHCHNCGKGRVRKIIWRWFKKYCSKCLPLMALDASAVRMRMNAIGLWRVPGSDFGAIFDYKRCDKPRYTTWQNEFNSCHAPQVQRFEQDWHDAGDNLEALTKLYRDRKAHVEGEIKFAEQLENYAEEDRISRLVKVQQARKDALPDLRRRLKEAGWGVEAEYYPGFIPGDIFYGPGRHFYTPSGSSKLTDKEWQKVYRYLAPRLIPLRSRRIDTLWETTYDKIYAAIVLHYTSRPLVHAGKSCYTLEHRPTTMDIAWMQECEELFIDTGIPNESALRAHLNTVVAPRVPQLVALWEERFKARLRELVLAVVSPADVSKDIDPLDLAVAVFGYADRISLAGARRACAALLGANCDPSRITLQEMETWDSDEGMWIPPAHMIVKTEPTTADLVWNDGRIADAGAQSTDSGLWDTLYNAWWV
ncbi:hypothetical protein VTO73DRAFT_7788 [Trametes versicolor]